MSRRVCARSFCTRSSPVFNGEPSGFKYIFRESGNLFSSAFFSSSASARRGYILKPFSAKSMAGAISLDKGNFPKREWMSTRPATKPGVPNIYGAVGKEANSIKPLKTPLSSMSPTLVLIRPLRKSRSGYVYSRGKAQPYLAIGARGGTHIITCVAQVLINHLGYGLPLFDAITAPRFHQQWRPDVLEMEQGFSSATINGLKDLGHKISNPENPCRAMAVGREKPRGKLNAATDPRDYGSALAY